MRHLSTCLAIHRLLPMLEFLNVSSGPRAVLVVAGFGQEAADIYFGGFVGAGPDRRCGCAHFPCWGKGDDDRVGGRERGEVFECSEQRG